MTLGELINDLERLELKHGAEVQVLVPGSFGGLEAVDFGAEYSEKNDAVVIW